MSGWEFSQAAAFLSAAASAPAAGGGAAAGGAAPKVEEKEKEEEEEVDMGGLFGDDDDGYWSVNIFILKNKNFNNLTRLQVTPTSVMGSKLKVEIYNKTHLLNF